MGGKHGLIGAAVIPIGSIAPACQRGAGCKIVGPLPAGRWHFCLQSYKDQFDGCSSLQCFNAWRDIDPDRASHAGVLKGVANFIDLMRKSAVFRWLCWHDDGDWALAETRMVHGKFCNLATCAQIESRCWNNLQFMNAIIDKNGMARIVIDQRFIMRHHVLSRRTAAAQSDKANQYSRRCEHFLRIFNH